MHERGEKKRERKEENEGRLMTLMEGWSEGGMMGSSWRLQCWWLWWRPAAGDGVILPDHVGARRRPTLSEGVVGGTSPREAGRQAGGRRAPTGKGYYPGHNAAPEF